MTKIFNLFLFFVCGTLFSQVAVSLKVHSVYPTASPNWKNLSSTAINVYESRGKNNVGLNAGLSLKIDLVKRLFLMPEIYYTSFHNDFIDGVSHTTIEAKNKRADLPILLGTSLLGKYFDIYAGPVASYNLSHNNTYNDFVENVKSRFSVGYQIGTQINIKDFIISGRYEGSFTNDQRDFINAVSGQTIRYDNRPSLFLAGIGYQF